MAPLAHGNNAAEDGEEDAEMGLQNLLLGKQLAGCGNLNLLSDVHHVKQVTS
jgi:hypothetical protein